MANWLERLRKWWTTRAEGCTPACRRSSRHGGRRRSLHLQVEALEDRLVPAQLLPPVAVGDSVSLFRNTVAYIEVLDNDSDPDGTLDTLSIAIATNPAHGTATPGKSFQFANDNSTAAGNGQGSA